MGKIFSSRTRNIEIKQILGCFANNMVYKSPCGHSFSHTLMCGDGIVAGSLLGTGRVLP